MADDIVFDFDAVMAARREEAGVGPKYKLAGQVWDNLAIAPAHVLRDLIGNTNSVDATFDYLKQLVVEEQRDEFAEKVLASDDYDLELLAKVVEYLTEAYNGRPTEAASPST